MSTQKIYGSVRQTLGILIQVHVIRPTISRPVNRDTIFLDNKNGFDNMHQISRRKSSCSESDDDMF